MTVAEKTRQRLKLAEAGKKDLEDEATRKAAVEVPLRKEDPKAHTMKETDAQAIAEEVKGAHYVFEDVTVAQKGDRGEYVLNLAGKTMAVAGSGVEKEKEGTDGDGSVPPNIIGLSAEMKGKGGHKVKIDGTLDKVAVNVYSTPKSLNALINEKRQEIHENRSLDPQYKEKDQAIKDVETLKATLGSQVGSYKRAVDNAYSKEGKKSDITTAYQNAKAVLNQIANNLDIIGVEVADWDLPKTNVSHDIEKGMAKRMVARPLTVLPGNTAGSGASAYPIGWDKIPSEIRASHWVRAHLLNHKLHGPGDQTWNLFPGTKIMNTGQMENQVERPAKNDLKGKNVLYYEVDLTYGHPDPYSFIPSQVHMQYGFWDVPGDKILQEKVNLVFSQDPPSGTAIPENDLNLSSSESLSSVAESNGKPNMHGFFENLKKERKNGKFNQRMPVIRSRMETYYVSNSTVLATHMENLRYLVEDLNAIVIT